MPFDSTPAPVETTPEIAILDEARALIATPDRWHKGSFCSTDDDGGLSFCALGAVREVVFKKRVPMFGIVSALSAAVPREPGSTRPYCIGDYNDAPTTTHADVLRLFDDARERLMAFDRLIG